MATWQICSKEKRWTCKSAKFGKGLETRFGGLPPSRMGFKGCFKGFIEPWQICKKKWVAIEFCKIGRWYLLRNRPPKEKRRTVFKKKRWWVGEFCRKKNRVSHLFSTLSKHIQIGKKMRFFHSMATKIQSKWPKFLVEISWKFGGFYGHLEDGLQMLLFRWVVE